MSEEITKSDLNKLTRDDLVVKYKEISNGEPAPFDPEVATKAVIIDAILDVVEGGSAPQEPVNTPEPEPEEEEAEEPEPEILKTKPKVKKKTAEVKPEEPKEEKKNVSQIKQLMTEDARNTKEFLDSQPKRTFAYPLKAGEAKGSKQSFCINGYKIEITKGVMVEVPLPIYEMAIERINSELGSGYLESEKQILISANGDKQNALS